MVEFNASVHSEGRPSYTGPLHSQIHELLKKRIRSQSWAVGSTLPNEMDLAREYGVSVGTMRKALQSLETLGWISRRRGRGTFVSDPQAVLNEKTSHFYKNGKRIFPDSSNYLDVSVGEADAEEASRLHVIAGDKILRVSQLQEIKGAVRLYDRVSVAERLIPGLYERNDLPDQFTSVYFEFGIVISKTTQTFASISADAEIAKILDVPEGKALLSIHRMAYETDGRPIEYCHRVCFLENADYSINL